ncbi:MAG: hypothetical protein ACLUB5_04570 [Bifidobacterium dentium]
MRFRNIEVFVDARFRHTSVHRPARFVVGIVDAVKRRFDRLHNIELFIGKIVAVAAQPESFRRAQSDHIKIVFGSNVSDARSTGFHKSRAANRSNGDACAEFVTPRQMIMSSVSGNGWLNIERNISAFAPSMSGTSPLIQTLDSSQKYADATARLQSHTANLVRVFPVF